jgi:hypothetical protein
MAEGDKSNFSLIKILPDEVAKVGGIATDLAKTLRLFLEMLRGSGSLIWGRL